MRNWRSIRVFTSDPDPSLHWYYEILERIVRPWLNANQGVDYFFTRYSVPVPADPPAPNLAALPPASLLQLPGGGQMHRSVRIRFVEPDPVPAAGGQVAPANGPIPAPTPVEDSLRGFIALDAMHFWRETPEPYHIGNGLGDERFSAFVLHHAHKREDRGENVAQILKANCDLVLSSFQYNQGNIAVETSAHADNQVLRTPFQSVGHMLANVWWNDGKAPANIWVIDQANGFGTKI